MPKAVACLKPIMTLMGPTASGKTALALRLYQALPIALISVDSMMVYRGMEIGTGKPSPEILQAIPHALVDIRDPLDYYCVADFCKDAQQAIDAAHAADRIPLLVGGTMMYFHALKYGLAQLPERDPLIRAQLEDREAREGLSGLYEQLLQWDPVSAQRIHPQDPQRIHRALEVCWITGGRMSDHLARQRAVLDHYAVHEYALIPPDRAVLHHTIEQRFLEMIAQGWVGEVKKIIAQAVSASTPLPTSSILKSIPALRAVGYQQIVAYLQGDLNEEAMVKRGMIATRQLAKRQLTWLRGWKNLHHLNPDLPSCFDTMVHVIEKLKNT
jgi:tRNA dimethylallyltransferase